MESTSIEFCPKKSPIPIERCGNWAVASNVISNEVYPGSVLSHVRDEPVMMMGYDAVAALLSYWKPPLQLTFQIQPRLTGWLTLIAKEKGKGFMSKSKQKQSKSIAFLLEML